MTQTLRILILEENPADAELVQFELQEAGFVFTAKVVMTEKDFVRELHTFSPDLILSDYDLPHYNGAAALAEAKQICPDAPFILITGSVSEDRAIEMLTQGAKDYVSKDRLRRRLVPVVRRSLAEAEERRARQRAEAELREAHRTLEKQLRERTAELRESRERLSLALTSSGMGTFDWDIVEDKRYWDDNLHFILGTRPEDFSGTTEDFFNVVHPEDRNTVQAFLLNALEHDTLYDIEYRVVWPDKSVHYVAVREEFIETTPVVRCESSVHAGILRSANGRRKRGGMLRLDTACCSSIYLWVLLLLIPPRRGLWSLTKRPTGSWVIRGKSLHG